MVSDGRCGISTLTATGIGERAASPETAASRPRSVSTGGWTPRTSWRSSTSASLASVWARSMRSRAPSGSVSNLALARPSSMATETRRCWAPSWRSRSMRRRSASAAPTTRARLSSSWATRAASPRDPGPSSSRARALSTVARPWTTSGAASEQDQPGEDRAGQSQRPPDGPSADRGGAARQRAVVGGEGDQGHRDGPDRQGDGEVDGPHREAEQAVSDLAPRRGGAERLDHRVPPPAAANRGEGRRNGLTEQEREARPLAPSARRRHPDGAAQHRDADEEEGQQPDPERQPGDHDREAGDPDREPGQQVDGGEPRRRRDQPRRQPP